jgi:hypothetical protein
MRAVLPSNRGGGVSYVRGEVPSEPGLDAEWLGNGGARTYVAVRGARYHRDIPKNGLATLREAGVLLRVDPATVWRWVNAGRLEGLNYRGVQVVGLAELRKLGLEDGYLVKVRGGKVVPAG